MLSTYHSSRGVVLARVRGRLEALFKLCSGTFEAGRSFTLAEVFPSTGAMLVLASFAVIIGLAVFALFAGDLTSGAMLAIAPAATTRDLKAVLTDLKAFQDAHKGKAIPEAEAAKFEALVAEAKAMQDEVDRAETVAAVEESERKGRKLATRTIPDDDSSGDSNDGGDNASAGKPAGYMSLGDYVTSLKSVRDFVANGSPKAQVILARLEGAAKAGIMYGKRRMSEAFVPLSGAEVKALRDIGSSGTKAVPTIGAGVIEPTLIPEMVRATEHDALRLRDILDISRTDKDAVKYTKLVSFSRAATTVAASGSKPQSAGLVLSAVTESVRTAAVWIPVENQQLEDMPALSGIINNELLYDLDKLVEELVMYGDGVGENFSGIIPDTDVLDARNEVGDTLIDIARRGITDVRKAGYEPNGILLDPLDWESIVLQKGTDNRYVWVVVTEGATARLWSVGVVESVAAEELGTGARNMLIGDFRRGATLWDRMSSTISVGWINDQFTKNQRTILAEWRAAFGVKRPLAFRKYETEAAGS